MGLGRQTYLILANCYAAKLTGFSLVYVGDVESGSTAALALGPGTVSLTGLDRKVAQGL